MKKEKTSARKRKKEGVKEGGIQRFEFSLSHFAAPELSARPNEQSGRREGEEKGRKKRLCQRKGGKGREWESTRVLR